MKIYFILTKFFMQPLLIGFLGIGLVIVLLWRKHQGPRRWLVLLSSGFVVLVLSTIPAVLYFPIGALESPFPPIERRPSDTGAIVVLSGGILPPNTVRRRPELTEDTVYRCLEAAELYHQGPVCPVIVTGGKLDASSTIPPVAHAMRDFLIRLGVDASDVIVEDRARTTLENATETKKLLARHGISRVVLVTEALHMYRSLRCFRKQGIEAIPAACHHQATEFEKELGFFLPSPGAVKNANALVHEWLGIVWYRLRGWMS